MLFWSHYERLTRVSLSKNKFGGNSNSTKWFFLIFQKAFKENFWYGKINNNLNKRNSDIQKKYLKNWFRNFQEVSNKSRKNFRYSVQWSLYLFKLHQTPESMDSIGNWRRNLTQNSSVSLQFWYYSCWVKILEN